ncbi:MAG: DEAD/DEAH box helicase [Proteobacteria bacterium]|nr:DEAD/DEAH box helicase [Pseudomonadota bacterium]
MYQPAHLCDDAFLNDVRKRLMPHHEDRFFAYLPALTERRVPIPARFRFGPKPIRDLLAKDYRFQGGIRLHHGESNSILEAGQNPILTTPTGSGKSMVFMLEALYTILAHPGATVMAQYVTRALNADQLYKWQELVAMAGLPPEIVTAIDGTVPVAERAMRLRNAKIVAVTPDVDHTYFLGHLDIPEVRAFHANRRLMILEEAQLYSGGFGTHMMFKQRRSDIVQQYLNPRYKREVHGRIIATSATIAEPTAFMKRLTGQDFVEVGEEYNGASRYPRLVGISGMGRHSVISAIKNLALQYPEKKFLVFCDSRTGVEEMAEDLGERAIPIKSGISGSFQRDSLAAIRNGDKNIVVATSALEVGVDLDFDFVFNLGLPLNLGSAHQRIGRGGRHGPGFIMFCDPAGMLEDYEHSALNYLASPLTPQILHPGNQFIQLAAAMSMRREKRMITEAMGAAYAKTMKFSGVTFPVGFNNSYKLLDGDQTNWPWHLRTVLPPRGSSPHHYHTMRNIGGISWKVGEWDRTRQDFKNLGTTTAIQAFFEFQPGAIIRHMKRRWRVAGWTTDKWGTPVVRLIPYDGTSHTQHKVVQFGQAQTADDALISDTVMTDAKAGSPEDNINPAFIAECRFRLHTALYGFNETFKAGEEGYWRTKTIAYLDDEDLTGKDPHDYDGPINDYGPKRRMLIDSTGIVIHLPHHRFGKDAREVLGQAIVREYCELFNVDKNDIGYIYERAHLSARNKETHVSHNLVIYDRIAGSLRLTHHLPKNIKRILGRIIKREAATVKETADDPKRMSERFKAEYLMDCAQWMLNEVKKLETVSTAELDKRLGVTATKDEEIKKTDAALPEGFIRVMAPGSRADHVRNGVATRVRILEPRVYEGCPLYEVLSVDRWSFYSKARARRLEKSDAFGFSSDERPWFDAGTKTMESSRAIPANDLILTAGRWIGYNPKTGKYIELGNEGTVEDISVVMEDKMKAMREKVKLLQARSAAEAAERAKIKPVATSPAAAKTAGKGTPKRARGARKDRLEPRPS